MGDRECRARDIGVKAMEPVGDAAAVTPQRVCRVELGVKAWQQRAELVPQRLGKA